MGTRLPSLKRVGHKKLYPALEGGGGMQKISDQQFSCFVASLPVLNDQSLRAKHFMKQVTDVLTVASMSLK